jgi:predicted amidohydrolase
MKLAFLHLSPKLGDLAYNRGLIERAIHQAADAGAEWILTPELCQSGYDFVESMGTDWIQVQPDSWMRSCMALARELNVVLFLAAAERRVGDPAYSEDFPEVGRLSESASASPSLYNSLFVIGRDGLIVGRHRKVSVIPGIEGWATAGTEMNVVEVDGHKVGMLICADAYRPGPTARLKDLGAEVLVSAAAWCPKPHGPEGAWQQRSLETGLPLFVCNRTGMDRRLDFSDSETGVYMSGKQVIRHVSPDSALILVDWDLAKNELLTYVSKPM